MEPLEPLEDRIGSRSTQQKLSALTERFHGFERQVEADAKARREMEESMIDGIKGTLQRLEQSLAIEKQKRTDVHKQLQATFEAQVTVVQDKLETVFLERYDHVQSVLDALCDRMATVETDFVESGERYIRDMEDKSTQLNRDIAAFSGSFTAEVQERKKREATMHRRLDDLEARSVETFQQQHVISLQRHTRMSEEFADSKRIREEAHKQYQEAAIAEVASIAKQVSEEAALRQKADDDIVNALNHYTKSLQEALRSVSQQALRVADSSAAAVTGGRMTSPRAGA
eukprot:TRINITY_DN36608_c0_g2_i1.p1 TRINITY_DN36608_c0_g2~~TRINITY_DN36608_c0_g2_i1.p1  ORF type:complete len:286 (+),score=97.21 TRINITY_DN36608_c0_g2_i1:80-937(+)